MTKKKTGIKKRVPSQPDLATFIDGAEDTLGEQNPFDPNEPRTSRVDGKTKPFKTIGLQFNRYEWFELEQAEKRTKRSKNSLIREGLELVLKNSK